MKNEADRKGKNAGAVRFYFAHFARYNKRY